ncbi:hypothetical protein [Pseudoxanthomonas beigongshangi]
MKGKKKPAAAIPDGDWAYLFTEEAVASLRRMHEQVQMAAVLIAPRKHLEDDLHILPLTELLYDHASRLREALHAARRIRRKDLNPR